jgi:putative transferase (TIGR04331 family)
VDAIGADFQPDTHVALGPWCFQRAEGVFSDWDQLEFPDPFATADERRRADLATCALANHVLDRLRPKFNARHGVQFSRRFWHIVAMYWLCHLIQFTWRVHEHVRLFVSQHQNIALYEVGYRNLVGVDAMRSAISLFAERAPAAFSGSEVHHDLFQRFLMRQPDGRFELTYSHGSTIELVHPSFDVVAHICRVTRRHVCPLITESEYFRRDWTRQFDRRGFRLVHPEPLRDPVNGAKLFVFSRSRDDAALAHGSAGQPDA